MLKKFVCMNILWCYCIPYVLDFIRLAITKLFSKQFNFFSLTTFNKYLYIFDSQNEIVIEHF